MFVNYRLHLLMLRFPVVGTQCWGLVCCPA